jgi:hypothetical protein
LPPSRKLRRPGIGTLSSIVSGEPRFPQISRTRILRPARATASLLTPPSAGKCRRSRGADRGRARIAAGSIGPLAGCGLKFSPSAANISRCRRYLPSIRLQEEVGSTSIAPGFSCPPCFDEPSLICENDPSFVRAVSLVRDAVSRAAQNASPAKAPAPFEPEHGLPPDGPFFSRPQRFS